MSIHLLVSFLLLHLCFSSLSFFSFSCSIVSHSSVLYFSITLSFLTYIVLCLLCFHTLFFRSFISTSFSFIICFVLFSVPQFQCFLLLPFFWSPIVCFVSKLCSSDPPSFLLSSFSCFIICFVLICSIPVSLCLSSSVFSSFHSPGLLFSLLLSHPSFFPISILSVFHTLLVSCLLFLLSCMLLLHLMIISSQLFVGMRDYFIVL